jgi:hypothetical protein
MLKCKQVSQLVSRALNERLSMRERFSLQFHLLICKYCLLFSQQLNTLNVAINKIKEAIEGDTKIILPPETKIKIAQSLESED